MLESSKLTDDVLLQAHIVVMDVQCTLCTAKLCAAVSQPCEISHGQSTPPLRHLHRTG